MLHVLTCIRDQHDYRVLVLAAIVCVAGSWVGIKTFTRAQRAVEVGTRMAWVCYSAVAIAAGEWSTHFLAMLAYKPGLNADLNLGTSVESLVVALGTAAAGIAVGSSCKALWARGIGGVIVGCGLAAMHFIGMQAYEITGHITWDMTYVAWSIVIAVVFSALALNGPLRPTSRFSRFSGAMYLTVGICGLHFTGMAAVTLIPDPRAATNSVAVLNAPFALTVAAVALLVIGGSIVTYAFERRISVASELRMARMANATTEGIVIVRDGMVTAANDKFLQLVGLSLEGLLGVDPLTLWSNQAAHPLSDSFESEVISAKGERIPVQVIASTMARNERIYTIRDLRARRAAEARLRYMADHDLLTGLANRRTFTDAVDEAIAATTPFAVIYVDLDRFKETNNTQGQAIGDAVLVEVAHRMAQTTEGCLCARLGGDEFAALVKLTMQSDNDFADDLFETLRIPFRSLGKTIRMGASIGVSLWPRDGATSEEILANADTAMYEAKRERSYAVRRFDVVMGAAARRRRTLSHDIALAADDGTLSVHYQVQTDVVTGATIGFEALLRWQHPALGAISPAEFIPLAEENGAISSIGSWVMQRACLDAKTWPAPLTLAVNLSPAQFTDDVAEMIAGALRTSGLEPQRLEVEITESLLIDDPVRALAVLGQIKALGVAIAMDDFGTGYSSLQTLQAFPFDKIKIDRSFVDKLETSSQARAIVRAVVGLGKSLGVPILAEGVETEAHLAFLKNQGCSSAQGYLMGRPTPLEGTRDHISGNAMISSNAMISVPTSTWFNRSDWPALATARPC